MASRPPVTPHLLADRLVQATSEHVGTLLDRHGRGRGLLPRVFAGHRVGPDAAADLAYTLGLLHGGGVTQIGRWEVLDTIATALGSIAGPATDTFSSYRVAEAVLAAGPHDRNEVLARLTAEEVADVHAACDSTATIELLDAGLYPANYHAVLARCEHDRTLLGLLDADDATLSRLVEATRGLLTANPSGFLDDHPGTARYDIYSADIYLFAEPYANRLGEDWTRGLRNVLDLVADVVAPNGAAVTWGRSLGALSVCLTIELAAVGIERGLVDDPSRWLGLADLATSRFDDWISDGLISAHQRRSPWSYRGPSRRLQMTLDCLGKLAWSAQVLRRCDPGLVATPRTDLFVEPVDVLHTLSDDPVAAVWAYRDRSQAFVVPFVGGTEPDYLPAPRLPGRYEVPVERDLPTAVPVAWRKGHRHVTGGPPREVVHGPGEVTATWDALVSTTPSPDGPRRMPADVRTTYRVDGRALEVTEEISFTAGIPDALTLQVCETDRRPLHVEFDVDRTCAVDSIDTGGLQEYRSFWAELPRLHQVDVDPAATVRIRWRATPKFRVLSNSAGHWYHRSLYDAMADRVVDDQLPVETWNLPGLAADRFRHTDLFHLHWPEHFLGTDIEAHRRFLDTVERYGVRLVWTQHNRLPHDGGPGHEDVYALWAERAHGVVHHSAWGRDVMLDAFAWRPDAVHAVIPHGHWGDLLHEGDDLTRESAEADLGLEPCAIRLGIVGAPRDTKDVQLVLDAFHACGRDDLQLVVLSLDGERVPDDPRITAHDYAMVPRGVYNRRLRALDAVVFPISAGGSYLTSGVVGDAVGLGLPSIVADFDYLTEILGDAGIVYGTTREDLTRCLDQLDTVQLDRAGAAVAALQHAYSWPALADRTVELFEAVGTTRP